MHFSRFVDCHFADWKFGPADSAADFSFHWRLVVGPPHTIRGSEIPALVSQLRDCRVALSKNDTIVDQGVGANALGHPLTALATSPACWRNSRSSSRLRREK